MYKIAINQMKSFRGLDGGAVMMFSVKFSAISLLLVEVSVHFQPSPNFADLGSQLSVEKRVISQLTVQMLANSQLAVKLYPGPLQISVYEDR